MARIAPLLVLALACLASPAGALPPGSTEAADAIALCERADAVDGAARLELLDRGVALARTRLEVDSRDALAHFAVFCNLGRRVQATGLGLFVPFELLEAMRALDAALSLAPDDPDVLTAKGALATELPRLLGGDPDGAAGWFRRALERDPANARARAYLERITRSGSAPAALQARR